MTHQQGFTLAEALTALAVCAILIAMAAPSFHSLVARQQLIASANAIAGMINMARAHGMASGVAYLCDGERGCDEFAWTSSLVLTSSALQDVSTNHTDILYRHQFPEKVRVTWRRFRGSALRYGMRGHTYYQNGHLLVCHSENRREARKIVMNWIGRPRIEAADPKACNER